MTRHLTLFALIASVLVTAACAPEAEDDQPQAPLQGTWELEATPMAAPATALVAPRAAAGCLVQGQAQIQQLEARWILPGVEIEFELKGLSCGAPIRRFAFQALDHDGVDVSGRSWIEVDSIEEDNQGRFTLRGQAVSCGDMSRGQTLRVFFFDEDYQALTEITVPIQP